MGFHRQQRLAAGTFHVILDPISQGSGQDIGRKAAEGETSSILYCML